MTFDPRTLKVGDEVAVKGSRPGSVPDFTTVARISPTGQIALANGERFTSDGRKIGGSHGFYSMSLCEPTNKLKQVRERSRLISELSRSLGGWEKLPTSTLLRLKAVLSEATNGDEA